MEMNYDISSSKTLRNALLICMPVAKTQEYGRNRFIQLPMKGGTVPVSCNRNMKVFTP
jgi:hypothetical protein